jgi:hydrophobe/amphiphile efflux-1 (HAE1) family protein
MRLNISAWSIRRPVPSIILFVILTALGVMAFRGLPVERFPNIDFPLISVTVTQAGASPSELETQVSRRVEDAVSSVVGVKHMTSVLTDGASTTTIEFQLETNADRALNDVKDAITRIRTELPRTINEPIISRIDVTTMPIVTYAVSAPQMTLEELSWFIDDKIGREVQSVRGVAQIWRIGGVDREIRVALDPQRLLALGVTAGDVNAQLRGTNADLSGGRSEIGGAEQTIRTLGGATTVERLASTSITLPGGRNVRLDGLGKITDSYEEPRSFARLYGKPIVALSILRAKGASDLAVAERVEAKMQEIAAKYPQAKFSKIDATVDYTAGNYHATMDTLVEGAVLAIIVVFLFLRDMRATVIAAIALPLSILPAFFAMQTLGFSLNLVTLLSLTLVTGILVDDAIVEVENIVRHMRMGKSAYRAALEAADEIGLAVIAITMTIIAVFVPVSFMSGIAGQYFKQFGITVAAAVFFSLLVARLLTPMLAAYFMRDHGDRHHGDGWVMQRYTRLLDWSVHHRLKAVATGIAILAVSIASTTFLSFGFMPGEDANRILIAAELPPGSRLADMDKASSEISKIVSGHGEVTNVFVIGGRILAVAGGGEEVRKATLIVNLTDKAKRSLSQRQLEQAISAELQQIADVRTWILKDNGERDASFVVSGPHNAAVTQTAARIASQMQRVPDLAHVVTNSALDRPELRFRPRPGVAAELGVSTEALSEAIRIATIGDISANLPKFNAGNRQVPIRVQLDEAARSDPRILESLKVMTAAGVAVPLVSVAAVEMGQGPSSIERFDRQRRVMITADLNGTDALARAVNAVLELPAAKAKPEGVTFKVSGDAEIMGEVFASFGLAMAAGVLMVFGVLVLLFGSFMQPITILASLPFTIGGVIIALLITGRPMSMPVIIGMLMLMGIVTKNAIMLVDFAIEEIARGVPRYAAIVDAGRKRARPIVMTTIAMVGGMLPSALAMGAGGEFRSPMAIAVMGGLIVSTMLSLVFVPAVFIVVDDLANFLWRGFGRFVGDADEEPANDNITVRRARPAATQIEIPAEAAE